jgi:hypothetical protein
MIQAALLNLWPLAVALAFTCCGLALLVQSLKSKVQSQRRSLSTWNFGLWTLDLHRDQRGSVQSLSFVLTVPIFIMLMLLAVQITQLMIGLIVVHYAAFAAARSATVWVPARLEPDELENRIGQRTEADTEFSGEIWQIAPGGRKYERIRQAAALACVPIAPSRDLGVAAMPDATSQSLISMFAALSPTAATNPRIPQRLANKWAYANAATTIVVRTFHRRYGQTQILLWDEPPLWDLEPTSVEGYYKEDEIGYRDQIRVTVYHQFALLPGPGRLLARRANESVRPDTVSPRIQSRSNSLYTIQLSATATMVGEGEKSVRPYVHLDL